MFRVKSFYCSIRKSCVLGLCLSLTLVQIASIWHEFEHGDSFTAIKHAHQDHEHYSSFASIKNEHVEDELLLESQEHPDCSLCSIHVGDSEYIVAIDEKFHHSFNETIGSIASLHARNLSYHQNARAPPIS